MNFLAATLADAGAGASDARARVGDGAFRLDPADAARWRAAGGGPLVLGVRPEHLEVATAGDGLPGKVEFAEALGAETLLHVETSAGRVVVRGAPGAARGAAGDTVVLKAAPGALRLFDAQGSALGAAAPAPAPLGAASR